MIFYSKMVTFFSKIIKSLKILDIQLGKLLLIEGRNGTNGLMHRAVHLHSKNLNPVERTKNVDIKYCNQLYCKIYRDFIR